MTVTSREREEADVAPYRVGIIGTGRPRRETGATGFGMSHYHARGYLASGRCEIVALADVRRENAEAFRVDQEIPEARIFEDYRDLLREAGPEIVSVATWPHLHAEMVVACAEAGVRAVHCEKPMAPTWGEARRMHDACVARGVQLTFNHQRRFEAPYRTARRLLREGAVGRPLQIQAACPNLFDWGTHWFDMLFFYNGDTPASWVMGQIDARAPREVFGVAMEDQGVSYVGFENGVRGLLVTGDAVQGEGAQGGPTGQRATLGAAHRVIGTEGILEVAAPDSRLRVIGKEAPGWQEVPLDDAPGGIEGSIAAGIADLLAGLEQGTEPELSSHKAVRSTELIFATYESARRRARVDLPLEIEDSPFLSLLEAGEVGPPKPEGS
jgi:UDP-N-acetylglucosamine 3-dehydrogenase